MDLKNISYPEHAMTGLQSKTDAAVWEMIIVGEGVANCKILDDSRESTEIFIIPLKIILDYYHING